VLASDTETLPGESDASGRGLTAANRTVNDDDDGRNRLLDELVVPPAAGGKTTNHGFFSFDMLHPNRLI